MGKTRSHRTARRGWRHQQSQPKGQLAWPQPERAKLGGVGSWPRVLEPGVGGLWWAPVASAQDPLEHQEHPTEGHVTDRGYKAEQGAAASSARPEIARVGVASMRKGHGSPAWLHASHPCRLPL